MKKFYFLVITFLFLLNPQNIYCQGYIPLLNDSTTWDAWTHDYSLPFCSETMATRAFLSGDTVINAVTWKKIGGYNAVNITPTPCPVWAFDNTVLNDFALLREDTTSQKVWALNMVNGSEYLLFDFSLNIGQILVTSFNQDSLFPDSLMVDSVGMIQLLDGTLRKIIYMHYIGQVFLNEFMIEGIGGSAGLYLPPFSYGIGFATHLGCVKYNNIKLFDPIVGAQCPGLIGNTNSIKGNAFVDLNSNMIFDAGDSPLDHTRITETISGMFDFSDAVGNYRVYVTDSGNFNIEGIPLNNFTSFPPSYAVNFNSFLQTDSLNDFAYQPNSIFDDLELFMSPLHKIRSAAPASYFVHIRNRGTTNLNPVLTFHQDPVLQYVSSTIIPSGIDPDSVTWNLPVLGPFQTTNFTITFSVDSGLVIGTPVLAMADVLPVATDATPLNNYVSYLNHISGSYDPNDILVDRDTLFTNEFPNPPYLNYLIRFQNTGNDTAFTVRIENRFPYYLDVNTLEFVSSSHPVQMNWNPLLNQVDFMFDGINLPDSNINEVASNGYVAYRIKPVSSLSAGTGIMNAADIFFDLNPAISTNFVWTIIAEPTSLNESKPADFFSVYPNPAENILYLRFPDDTEMQCYVQLYDISRRVWYENTFKKNNQHSINTGSLDKGMYFIKINCGSSAATARFIKL